MLEISHSDNPSPHSPIILTAPTLEKRFKLQTRVATRKAILQACHKKCMRNEVLLKNQAQPRKLPRNVSTKYQKLWKTLCSNCLQYFSCWEPLKRALTINKPKVKSEILRLVRDKNNAYVHKYLHQGVGRWCPGIPVTFLARLSLWSLASPHWPSRLNPCLQI